MWKVTGEVCVVGSGQKPPFHHESVSVGGVGGWGGLCHYDLIYIEASVVVTLIYIR